MEIGGTLIAGPAKGPLKGDIVVPGDKSMSHRAVMLASLADGVTEIHGFLPGEDNISTAQVFVDMGVRIEWLNDEKTSLRVFGVGLHGLKQPDIVLNAGNAGTCVRLMTGVLAGQSFSSTMTGDASLRKRPMKRVVDPVRKMGAIVEGNEAGNLLPITITGGKLTAIHHVSEVASAQVKSCVLLAGLYADGITKVNEPKPTRDHTERMLPLFGQPVEVASDGTISLHPTDRLTAPADNVVIPADPSSACFFAVAASLVKDSDVTLKSIGINDRRDGWRRVMSDMGAALLLENEASVGEEPVADVRVRSGGLHGMVVNPDDVPDAIDEFPVLFAAAALADGEFVLADAEELRVKESDRISAMADALSAAGADITEMPDGAVIHGLASLKGDVDVDALGDHRIAMAMAVAAQRAEGEIRIHNAAAIATSFPNFVTLAQSIGMNVRWADEQ
ncbi:3-phosphoshikimate 1-carboxyvinyltransferase [Mariprofundus micogutta]|uniref:3-phosphoshikimate 1-carboxyvinyltransferase n=1 Tax=Mariprofundus micogutta TaxID=1921010 RepID=A0A1L8CLH6_9PROT|nr:3-phosphoshikimate 1-carboxyvinyltransferase [Mariprofundus micogutta]GAV19766.1 3-phosphoshikimate 1-carboxyvinyltransferase [Mariprofundus micogutta]